MISWFLGFFSLSGLSAIPVIGPILGIIGQGIGLVFSFLRWLFKDIEDAFKEPQRLLVRLVCLLAVLAFGVHEGVRWDAHKVLQARASRDEWKAAHAKLIEEAQKADDENKGKLAEALKAKVAAEKAASDFKTTVAAAPAAPERVRPVRRPAPAASKDGAFGPGLQWLLPVFGGGK